MDRRPTRTQCAHYALDRVHADGGYICFGMSTHWEIQHVAHYDNLNQVLSQFTPPSDLKEPWHSIFSFRGSVVKGDKDYRKPMPVRTMYLGVAALLLMIVSWHIKRAWDKFRGRT